MADLQQFETELRAEHNRLTQGYESQQEIAEREWAKLEAAKKPLADFRAKYGRVLKALDQGAIQVRPDGRETVTVTAQDVGVVDASLVEKGEEG